MGNIHSFCEVGLKISGVFPISARPIQEFDGADVTAVHFSETGSGSGVLVVGTSLGRLLVILLKNSGELKLLTDYQLTDASEVTKVVIAEDNDLILLQRNVITKIRASNCAAHKTCSACVSSGDPFCGWCALRNKCSHVNDCQAHQVIWVIENNNVLSGFHTDFYSRMFPSGFHLLHANVVTSRRLFLRRFRFLLHRHQATSLLSLPHYRHCHLENLLRVFMLIRYNYRFIKRILA
jgi:hypothetical protein